MIAQICLLLTLAVADPLGDELRGIDQTAADAERECDRVLSMRPANAAKFREALKNAREVERQAVVLADQERSGNAALNAVGTFAPWALTAVSALGLRRVSQGKPLIPSWLGGGGQPPQSQQDWPNSIPGQQQSSFPQKSQ